MNFRPELAAKVMAGEKTVTRRLVSDNPRSPWFKDRCGYRIGQTVAICPGRGKDRIGDAVVTSVGQDWLGFISEEEARAEGFENVRAFNEAWEAINREYDATAVVWRIGLEAQ